LEILLYDRRFEWLASPRRGVSAFDLLYRFEARQIAATPREKIRRGEQCIMEEILEEGATGN
jgi:hypothetical protein